MIDVDQQTDSNSDTALTLAAAGGHDELVTLLLVKGSDIEHRDKKGGLWKILLVRNMHCPKRCLVIRNDGQQKDSATLFREVRYSPPAIIEVMIKKDLCKQ